MVVDLPLGKHSKYLLARKRYSQWRNKTKESKMLLATLFVLCNGKCPVCGCDMVLGFNQDIQNLEYAATLDHTTPISLVLEHRKYGLDIMCRKCNSAKGNTIG